MKNKSDAFQDLFQTEFSEDEEENVEDEEETDESEYIGRHSDISIISLQVFKQ